MSEPGREPAQKAGAAPGQRLKEERERRGISTQKVAEDLHVDPWIVEALEAGQFQSLGAAVYAKGHLRKYATLLGLEPERLVAACSEQVQPPPPLAVLKTAKRRARPLISTRALSVGAVVLAVAVLAWNAREWQLRSLATRADDANEVPVEASQAGATAEQVPVAEDSAVAADAPAATPETQTTAAVTDPEPAAPAVTRPSAQPAGPQANMRLRLNFLADSWVEVYDAQERPVFYDLGAANSARSLTVTAPARLALGNAEGVQIEVNGQPVAVPVARRGVTHLTLDTRGRLERRSRPATAVPNTQ
jgi:cytoskeleton protein RodZ